VSFSHGYDPDWSHLDSLILEVRALHYGGRGREQIVPELHRRGYNLDDIYLCYQAAMILERC